MENINHSINKLLHYGVVNNFITERDVTYCANRLINLLGLDSFEAISMEHSKDLNIEDLLDEFRNWALESGLVKINTVESLDRFDTEVISQIIPMPSAIEREFFDRYDGSPESATDYYYDFAIKSNYIRKKRIDKDLRWKYDSRYGQIDLSINLSKPEKDPRDIANVKKDVKYPMCLLCRENEGFAGYPGHPARGNHRLIRLNLNKEEWYFQYSPYVYYNEHAIVLKAEHVPMKISQETFVRLLEFVEQFPHYFIGSNADLPIVGGSILSHDHFQGGNYTFPMELADELGSISLSESVDACILDWPLSVIRLRSDSREELARTSDEIFLKWKGYSNKELGIFSHTEDTEHNTITPIARMRDGKFEMDLVLRNNLTTGERPYGVYHPREEYHHIKKENIGLIEVMGLAVLPARLKDQLARLQEMLLSDQLEKIRADEELSMFYDWALDIANRHQLNEYNIESVIYEEVGSTFVSILEDCGVFKGDAVGRNEFMRFLTSCSK